MKLYIAGPMRGYPQQNYPEFMKADHNLRALGYDVINPALLHHMKTDRTQEEIHQILRVDLAEVLKCDGVALLDGWQTSEGARLEKTVALGVGIRVAVLNFWLSNSELATMKPT